jgi:hypothetical protein
MNENDSITLGVLVSVPKIEQDRSRELFDDWFKDFSQGFINHSIKNFGKRPPDYAVDFAREMTWEGWSSRPITVNAEDLDAVTSAAIKTLGQQVEDLKQENRKLRHTIDNVLSEGTNGN